MRTFAAVLGLIAGCAAAAAQTPAFKDSLRIETPSQNAIAPNAATVETPRSALKGVLTFGQDGAKSAVPDRPLKGSMKIEDAKN
jgi:hypothetical protein